jgi:hypothetical protein
MKAYCPEGGDIMQASGGPSFDKLKFDFISNWCHSSLNSVQLGYYKYTAKEIQSVGTGSISAIILPSELGSDRARF